MQASSDPATLPILHEGLKQLITSLTRDKDFGQDTCCLERILATMQWLSQLHGTTGIFAAGNSKLYGGIC